MDGKIFFNKFFPLLIIITFLKGVLAYIIPIFPFDFYSALYLALIPLLSLNFYSLLSIFLISILKALETYHSTMLFVMVYFILFIGFQYLKKGFKTETQFFLFLFWALSLVFFLIIKTYIFFNTLSLAVLDYPFWLNFIMKTLGYFFLTFMSCLSFHQLFKRMMKFNDV